MRHDAGLSLDVDSVSSHLAGYGYDPPPDDGAAYRRAVPRALDALEHAGARATFFLIAEEARRHPDVVTAIVAAGHEVASHSMTHRLPFRGLDGPALERETAGSKAVLEGLTGRRVEGFRAPSWDAGPRLLHALVAAGYRYDSSAYPSFLLPLLRWSVARRSAASGPPAARTAWAHALGPSGLHRRTTPAGPIIEVPVCTAPGLRLPYYHTLRLLAPPPLFAAVRRLAHLRRGPVWYQFHAVDFLGMAEDGLDPRMDRHPGMRLPLDRKRAAVRGALGELGGGRAIVPLREIVETRFPAGAPRPVMEEA